MTGKPTGRPHHALPGSSSELCARSLETTRAGHPRGLPLAAVCEEPHRLGCDRRVMALYRSHDCRPPRPELGSRDGPQVRARKRSPMGEESTASRRRSRRPSWRRPGATFEASERAWHLSRTSRPVGPTPSLRDHAESGSRNGYGSAALPADAETDALQRELPGHSGGITHIHAGRPRFQTWFDDARKLRKLVTDLETLSLEASDLEGDDSPRRA